MPYPHDLPGVIDPIRFGADATERPEIPHSLAWQPDEGSRPLLLEPRGAHHLTSIVDAQRVGSHSVQRAEILHPLVSAPEEGARRSIRI